jgi:hypothetical protein
MGNAPRHLVEGGEHRDRILDDVGMSEARGEATVQREDRRDETERAGEPASA